MTVFDVYKKDSIKSCTRENRGSGMRISARSDTASFKKFMKFVREDENKSEVFQMLTESISYIK